MEEYALEMNEVMTSLLNGLLGNPCDQTGERSQSQKWEERRGEAQRLARVWGEYKQLEGKYTGRLLMKGVWSVE